MSTFKSGLARVSVRKLSWTPHLHATVKVGSAERWSGVINNSDASVLMSHGWSKHAAVARLALDSARQERDIAASEIDVDEYRQPIVSPVSGKKKIANPPKRRKTAAKKRVRKSSPKRKSNGQFAKKCR